MLRNLFEKHQHLTNKMMKDYEEYYKGQGGWDSDDVIMTMLAVNHVDNNQIIGLLENILNEMRKEK